MKPDELYQLAKQFLESDTAAAKTTKILLAVIALGAIFAIGTVAPNIFRIFSKHVRSRRFSRPQITAALQSLERSHYVDIEEHGSRTIVKITHKGKQVVKSFSLECLQIKKQGRWDGKWRVVVFDIPIRHRKGREGLRWKLKDMGFYQFQKSIWAYPYPCDEEILFVAKFFGVEKCVEVFIVDRMLSDTRLRTFFNL